MRSRKNCKTIVFLLFLPLFSHAQIETVTLEPAKDNTLYDNAGKSNGAGPEIFSGKTRTRSGGGLRRAVLQFDFEGMVPPGSTIQSATLTLTVGDRNASGEKPSSLHLLQKDWGEEGSNAGSNGGKGATAATGDATWISNFHGTSNWTNEGGDFESTASATSTVPTGINKEVTWTSAQMATDIENWVNTPSTNFGWILITDESSVSAKQFHSRESTSVDSRPKLTVEFTQTIALTRRQEWEAEHFPDDPENADDLFNLDNDPFNNLLEYAFDFDPKTSNPTENQPTSTIVTEGENTFLTITFRRDPRATDLTYTLEANNDLSNTDGWIQLVESVNGADATGSGLVSETPNGELRQVTGRIQTNDTSGRQHFLRLTITRTEEIDED